MSIGACEEVLAEPSASGAETDEGVSGREAAAVTGDEMATSPLGDFFEACASSRGQREVFVANKSSSRHT